MYPVWYFTHHAVFYFGVNQNRNGEGKVRAGHKKCEQGGEKGEAPFAQDATKEERKPTTTINSIIEYHSSYAGCTRTWLFWSRSPRRPYSPRPQVQTPPFSPITAVCQPPQATAVTFCPQSALLWRGAEQRHKWTREWYNARYMLRTWYVSAQCRGAVCEGCVRDNERRGR